MKKDGKWIACMDGELKTTRIEVDPNPVLDLIEVRRTPPGEERPSRIEFYDREEAAALVEQLRVALDRLEAAAVESSPVPRLCS